MSWMKQATIMANKPKSNIIDMLKKNMAGYEDARPHDVVHASDITKSTFCPRQWALFDILNLKPQGQYVGTALRATFNLGHATAKELVENWAEGYAVGNWKCKTCNATRTMTTKPATGCTGKGNCSWEYVEVSFVSKEYGVSGSLDVMFDLGTPKLAITELKTYSADEFDKMVAPLPEHRIRTQMYLKLVSDSDSVYKDKINLHQARILYVSRGYGKMNKDYNEILPFREFVVDRDDASPDLAFALKKAKQIKLFRELHDSKTPEIKADALIRMPSGICSTPLDKAAKNCSQCSTCFSGKYPPKQEALV